MLIYFNDEWEWDSVEKPTNVSELMNVLQVNWADSP